MNKRITLKELFRTRPLQQQVLLKGWIRSVRKSKKFSFLVLNDGTTQKGLQLIADEVLDNYTEVSSLAIGTSVAVWGTLVESGGQAQDVEVQVGKFEIIGQSDVSYPIQKKSTSLEFLREQAHLRIRTNTFGAVFRIRHALAMATHKFFDERGFFYLNSPIITALDGEGAGEMFRVSTLDFANPARDSQGNIDYSKDYFGREVSLGVTGQLEGESHALGLGAIYTFGPTFRSENSNTPRHLAEFWMIEPEVAFADLDDIALLAADYIKYLIDYALKNCPDELDFLAARNKAEGQENHLEVLKHVRDSEFVKITYTQAIEILSQSERKFEYSTEWGAALQTEHERYLTEIHFKAPVIVTDYPKECKAFYMKVNPDNKTVRAMDVLVPQVGEIIGGSQREDDYQILINRMKELKMKTDDYWWYLELRKYGSVPHSGFGLGFERAIMYITGMSNIRDVIPFPRTPKNAEF